MLGVAVLVVLAGFIIPTDGRYPVIADAAFLFAGVALLLKNGTFVYSKYVKFLNLSFALFIVAVLFKVQQWPGANIMLMAFPLVVTVIYALWFFSKPSKQLLDVLKLLWVPIFLTSVIVKMLYLPYATELYLAQLVVFVAMLGIFISSNFKKLINS